ncbi:MAG: hypothetical protein IPK94_07765 [Saprospiraceae bacterium]|nr:hypothetical protein [Saprospiraceae bacterium]
MAPKKTTSTSDIIDSDTSKLLLPNQVGKNGESKFSINVIQRVIKLKDYYIQFTILEKIGGYGTPIGPRPRIDIEFFDYPKEFSTKPIPDSTQSFTVITKLFQIEFTVIDTGAPIGPPPRSPLPSPPSPSISTKFIKLK